MRNSLSRRIALRRPRPDDDRASSRPSSRNATTSAARSLDGGDRRAQGGGSRRIPYIDPIDLRYRRFEREPKPVAQAVMFCLMDVSGSMTEHMKDLAKRFYVLLYIFLKRRYRHVEIVFIRHTHQRQEVDEETFFRSPRPAARWCRPRSRRCATSSSALPPGRLEHLRGAGLGRRQLARRRRQTTDGCSSDAILPVCQYFAYLEVGRVRGRSGGDAGFARCATCSERLRRRRGAAVPCAR